MYYLNFCFNIFYKIIKKNYKKIENKTKKPRKSF